MGKDTECGVMVQTQQPAVAEATEDKVPPIRVSMKNGVPSNPVLIKNKEYQMSSHVKQPISDVDSHARAYSSDQRHDEFCEWHLPLTSEGSDTTVLAETEQSKALDAIASSNEPVMLKCGEDLPNEVADPETIGREEKEKYQEELRRDLHDPKVLDVLSRLINMPNHETFRINLRALDAASQRGKQCGGGKGGGSSSKGSQTESSSSQSGQGGFVTGYSGRSGLSNLVTGLGGGGLGGAGGGDDDPFNLRPLNLPPSSHYAEFAGFEEQPENDDAQRNAPVMSMLTPAGNNPMLSQFNCTQEEPLSYSLEGMRPFDDIEGMEFDLEDTDRYLADIIDPSFQIAPTEESSTVVPQVSQASSPPVSGFPMPEESSSDIKEAFDMIHMMKPSSVTQRARPQEPTIGITPLANMIPPNSQISGLNSYPYPYSLPSPAPSTSSSYMAPTPSPRPPLTPMTPVTPAPSPMPPATPSTPQPRGGFFSPRSYIDGDNRVCELSMPADMPPENRNTVFQALLYVSGFYTKVLGCSQTDYDLKVANDVRAMMCAMECGAESRLKVSFTMPQECKPLAQWLTKNTDLKDRLLVLQQILNTLATIHTVGYADNLTLWGSFLVWVARDLRVHILVDFPLLLQKQKEFAYSGDQINPRQLDVFAVRKIYEKLIVPCIGTNGSWASPALTGALRSFEYFFSDPSSACRMAEAARMLGEKRVCKLEVGICMNIVSVVFYCQEREELQTALKDLSKIVPGRIAHVWTVQSHSGGNTTIMRVGDIATADRQMQLSLEPCMYPSDARLLYIECEGTG